MESIECLFKLTLPLKYSIILQLLLGFKRVGILGLQQPIIAVSPPIYRECKYGHLHLQSVVDMNLL